MDNSGHSAVEMKLHMNSIPIKIKIQVLDAGGPDWRSTMEGEEANNNYNAKMRQLSPNNNPNYTSFFRSVEVAAKCAATKIEKRTIDWFGTSKEEVQPIINKMYDLLSEYRKSIGEEMRVLEGILKLSSQRQILWRS